MLAMRKQKESRMAHIFFTRATEWVVIWEHRGEKQFGTH